MSYASYILDRINELCEKTGTSRYQLAKNSGIPESSLSNLFNKKHTPRLETLDKICDAFGITLAQFFAEGELVELTPEMKELFKNWTKLSEEKKNILMQMIKAFV